MNAWGYLQQASIQPLRLSMNKACELLDVTRSDYVNCRLMTQTSLRPLKAGDSRQCRVYYDYASLAEWHESKSSRLSCALIRYGGESLLLIFQQWLQIPICGCIISSETTATQRIEMAKVNLLTRSQTAQWLHEADKSKTALQWNTFLKR